MPVDWDATVQAATQKAFALPITLIPKATGKPITLATDGKPLSAILRYERQSFMNDDGTQTSTVEITLGIRLSSFPVFPQAEDRVTMISPIKRVLPPGLNVFTIDRFVSDGLAGASLVMKALQAMPISG